MQSDVDLIWESYLDIYENVRIGSSGSEEFLKGGNLPKSSTFRDLPPSDCVAELKMANSQSINYLLGLESNDVEPNYFNVYAKKPSGRYFNIGTLEHNNSVKFIPDKSLPLSMDNRPKMNPDINPLIKGMTEDDGEFQFRLKDNLNTIHETLNKMLKSLVSKRNSSLTSAQAKAATRTSEMLS